jgi:HK97 gp10 family phage protein
VNRAQIEGLRELQRKFRDIDKEAPKELRKTIRASGNRIRDDARSRVPRGGPYTAEERARGKRAGKGRGSIRVDIDREGLTGTVGSKLFYMRFREFGTRHQGAKPFLFPAAEAEAPRLRAEVTAVLNQMLERLGRLP